MENGKMIVTRGDGRIIKGLDKAGVIAEYRKAQAEGDRFCCCIGWISEGLDIDEIEREAGYSIGLSEAEIYKYLHKMNNRTWKCKNCGAMAKSIHIKLSCWHCGAEVEEVKL